jgi:hypothetical protein
MRRVRLRRERDAVTDRVCEMPINAHHELRYINGLLRIFKT